MHLNRDIILFFIPFCLFFFFSFFDCIVQESTVVVLNPSFPYLLSFQAKNYQVLLINNPLSITLYTEEIEKLNALLKSASDWVRFRGQPDYGGLSNNLRWKKAQYTLYIYQIRPLINTQAFNNYWWDLNERKNECLTEMRHCSLR